MFAEMLARQEADQQYRELELRMIRETTAEIFKLMEPHFDGFPNNYLVFDLETTGLNPAQSLITQFGYCLVKDSKPVDKFGAIINWTLLKEFCPEPLRMKQKLEEVKRHVEFKNGVPTGKKYHITFERMMDEGIHPLKTLELFHDLFTEVRKQRRFFVAHNGYHFDVPFVETHFDRFLGDDRKYGAEPKPPFYFQDNELFDTGMVEKGSQCQSAPWSTDTVKSWSLRTQTERLRHVRWALDTACVPRYQLDKRFNLDLDAAHDAGFDCYVCHLLFEEYKRITKGEPEPSALYQTNQTARGAPTPLPPWDQL